MTLDITASLAADSNQLNAIDLVAGPVTVQIKNVTTYKDAKQPYAVHISDGHKPWIPCKAMRRLLAEVWGADAGQWIGRWVKLYREPTATYASDVQGGVRVCGLSNIDKPFTATVPDSVTIDGKKKKLATYRVERLTPPQPAQQQQAQANPLYTACLNAVKSKRWTGDQVAILLRGGKAADVPEEERGNVMDALAAGPDDPKVAEFLADAAAEIEAKRQATGGGQ